jgi:hypothetical protein
MVDACDPSVQPRQRRDSRDGVALFGRTLSGEVRLKGVNFVDVQSRLLGAFFNSEGAWSGISTNAVRVAGRF